MHNKIFEMIQKQHKTDLNIKEDVYYLYLKNAVVSLFYDEEESTIKVEIETTPENKTFVYFNQSVSLEDLF